MVMIVYANGDSYGISLTNEMCYPEFFGNHLGATVINRGRGGVCNQRIIRNTVRDLTNIQNTTPNENILAIIGLGSMVRNEWWNPDFKPSDEEIDGHFQSFQIHGLKHNTRAGYYKFSTEWYRIYDDEAEQTNLMMNLILLTGWFESQGIDYLIFAGNNLTYKKIDYDSPFIKSFADKIFNNPRILNINDFSFTTYCIGKNYVPFDFDQWGINGHHGAEAHRDFAEFLFEYYNKL
jgi:hypothetical protein